MAHGIPAGTHFLEKNAQKRKKSRADDRTAPVLVKEGLEQRFRAFFQFFDNFGGRALTTVKLSESALEKRNAFGREFICMQAERMEVEGCKAKRVPKCTAARRNVVIDLECTAHESVGAHLVTLLHRRSAAESRKLANAHVAAELASVSDDRPFANLAVVPHMGVSHDEYVWRNASATTALNCAAIERRVFADDAIFANFKMRRLACVLEVLRRRPEDRPIVNMRIRLNRHTAVNAHSRFEHHIFANFRIFIDNAPGANNSRLVDFCGWMNKSGWMKHN